MWLLPAAWVEPPPLCLPNQVAAAAARNSDGCASLPTILTRAASSLVPRQSPALSSRSLTYRTTPPPCLSPPKSPLQLPVALALPSGPLLLAPHTAHHGVQPLWRGSRHTGFPGQAERFVHTADLHKPHGSPFQLCCADCKVLPISSHFARQLISSLVCWASSPSPSLLAALLSPHSVV